MCGGLYIHKIKAWRLVESVAKSAFALLENWMIDGGRMVLYCKSLEGRGGV